MFNMSISQGYGRVTVLFVSLLLLVATPASAQDDQVLVKGIEFEGLDTIDRALVEETLQIHPGDPYHLFQVTQSVRSMYELGLFEQVEVKSAESADGSMIITFQVTERPKISHVAFSGNNFFSIEDLKEHAALNPGQILKHDDMFQARRAIEQAYRDEGWAQATVSPEAIPDESDGSDMRVLFSIDEGTRVKVRQITFSGNTSFPPEALRGAMKLKPTGFLRKGRFQREKIEEDLLRLEDFYRNNGYKDARAFLDDPIYSNNDIDVEVRFRVEEGSRFYFAEPSWEDATVFEDELIQEMLLFQKGDPYDRSKVDATLAQLYNIYTERGYLVNLRIRPDITEYADTVLVNYVVQEGEPSRVDVINIIGNSRTKERVIRREMDIYPGQLMRRSLLLRSQRDIFATGYFEDVQVEFEPSEKPEDVDITFRVKEKSSAQANGGIGYSSQVGLTGFVKLGHNNLFGNGQSIQIEVERGSKREFYDLSFTEPWMFGRHISAGFDIYNTESYREVYSGTSYNDASYWKKIRGGGIRVGFPWFFKVPDYTRLTVGYSFSETRYTEYENLPPETIDDMIEGAGQISRIFFSFYRNSTDNPFHPTMGVKTTWRHEFNGGVMGGQKDYYRTTIDHRQYFVPFWKPVLMLRLRGGLLKNYSSRNQMPAAERFRLGGITGFDLLRGYDDYYLVPDENITYDEETGQEFRFPGGKTMFAFTAEFQFPLFDPIHGALFMDAGNTWNSAYDISLSGLKLGAGAGVSMEIPMLGPVGFYYGYGFERKEWKSHFAFGPQF
jgi:outer membrane protein insertion porin family